MMRGTAETASITTQNTVSSTSGRSIYPRGPQFSLDTFASKDFIVKDFVESLSDGTTPSSRHSGSHTEAFDPKPFIRTFEYALSRLGQLSDQRESHENELSLAVRRAEAQHKQHCLMLQRKLDQALESFNSLEQRLESTLEKGQTRGNSSKSRGAVALHFGERLQELDRQRRRAEDARFLIQCWQDVSERGDLSRLEDTRRMGGGQGKVKCAQIARQLLKISNKLELRLSDEQKNGDHHTNQNSDSNGPHDAIGFSRHRDVTNETIERFLERLEQDLLEQFDESKRQHNEIAMKECATALYDFGEGGSVIGRFVNQHEFFLERSHMISEPLSEDIELWNRLADPDAEMPGTEQSLQSTVDEVKLVLQEESFTIKKVFPFYEQVLTTFIQRVFQQIIQQRLEIVLEKAESVSSLAFLRSLQAARIYIGQMVDDLKAHGLTEHPESVSVSIAAALDQQLEELFVPYSAGSSYISRERGSLEELFASLLFKFTLYHSKKRKNSHSYLGSLSQKGRELLSSVRDGYVDRLGSSDLAASQKATLLRLAGLRDTDSAKDRIETELQDEDGVLSLPVAKRMLKWLAEAVGRGLELSGGTETSKDMAILLRILIVHLGDIYVDTALDTANDHAASQESAKTEPDLIFLPDLRVSVSILELMLSISHSVLLPLASPNVTVRREMEKSIASTVSRMEDKISTIRTRTIDVALSWVAKLLARQNRTDFRPRDEAFGLDQLQTQTCNSIFMFLTRVRDLSTKTFSGQNAETFFTELAIGIRSLLFEHFKKFPVNLAGGLMVSKDITKYIELLRTFPLSNSFLPSMEVLIEVGNIFVIGPEALKDRLRGGGALTGIDKSDLRPYVMRREDVLSLYQYGSSFALEQHDLRRPILTDPRRMDFDMLNNHDLINRDVAEDAWKFGLQHHSNIVRRRLCLQALFTGRHLLRSDLVIYNLYVLVQALFSPTGTRAWEGGVCEAYCMDADDIPVLWARNGQGKKESKIRQENQGR